MSVPKKADRILDAWLDFIQIENHSNAQVPEEDTELDKISLRQNHVLIDEAVFLDRKRTYRLDQGRSNTSPWVLSFPQIYKVEKGKSALCPLFSLDISPILSGDHQVEGWDVGQLPVTEAGGNLVAFARLEEEQIDKLVTKEGLHRFLETTFGTFESFEDWMKGVGSPEYRIRQEPYLFRYRGGNFSANLQKDLKAIRQQKERHWIKSDHPAYQYIFGGPRAALKHDVYYLGAFPTQPPTESQLVALKHALCEPMTAVQGPPGSGKTTLILHAIAQQIVSRALCIIEGKPDASNLTLVTSGNNRAVSNVIERLNNFEQPDGYLPVPFLCLKGGAKQIIDKPDGAAEQLEKARIYLDEHSYSTKTHTESANEIRQIAAEVAEKEAEYIRLKQQRMQNEVRKHQLKQEIEGLQQKLADTKNRQIQLKRRENQITYIDQLPVNAYEQLQSQFVRTRMQLPEEDPPKWIRWFYWLLGKTEPQIIAKALTDPYERAMSQTKGARFEITRPVNRVSLNKQIQRLDENLSCFQELKTVRRDLKPLTAQLKQLDVELHTSQASLSKLKSRPEDKLKDFYQTFHTLYEEQHKRLFHLSQQFLLQEALSQKDTVKKALESYSRFVTAKEEREHRADCIAKDLDSSMKALSLIFPVMTSSLLSVRNMLPWIETCIDRVIIDEAGMVLLHQSFPALVKARKALVVGDPLQIEPIVSIGTQTLSNYKRASFIQNKLSDDDYRLYSPSQIETATTYHRASNADKEGISAHEVKLKEHFRCQESIIDYCIDIASYELVCKTKPITGSLLGSVRGKKDGPNMVAYHVEGKIADQANIVEVEAVHDIFVHLVRERGYKVGDIGVISPFRAHADALRGALKRSFPEIKNDAVGTVHTFQGAEKQVIVFSAKVCQPRTGLEWLNSRPNILNVAVSRAKELFMLVGDLSYLESRRFTRKLIEHIKESGVVLEYKTESEVNAERKTASDDLIQNCKHIETFAQVLAEVEKDLCMVVPTIAAEPAYQFVRDVQPVLERGVRVTVIYGTPSLDSSKEERQPNQAEKDLKSYLIGMIRLT